MAFNREVIDSTATDYNGDEICENDFASNTIFVPIDRSFTVSFDDNIDVNTISVFTNNTDIETSERGKRGSIQLSSVGNDGLGSDADSLNLRLKKQTSSPDFVISSDGLIKDENATIEVEMLNAPVASNANSNFTFQPVINLASNSTYVFNITEDVKDVFGSKTDFTVGTGFVTDNSRSVILSTNPFRGYNVNLSIDNKLKFLKDEQVKKKGRNLPVATILEHEQISKITYDLNPVCYFINVAFTAANPCVITTAIPHGLVSDNKITVYEIVSGSGLSARTYNIASVGTNTITLDGVNLLNGTAGRISFFVNFHAGDEMISTGRDDNIQIKLASASTKNFVEIETNKELYQFLPTTTSTNYAKSIRYDDENSQLNYVPVTGADSNVIKATDNFANNIILKQKTESGPITMFVSANTNPLHNTHPFNTSAPTVINFEPDANDAITKKLEVVEILRSGSTAIVVTNSIHALGVGDTIQIIGCNETDYNKTTTVQEIIDSTSFTYEVSNDPRSPATPTNNRIEIKTGSSPSSQATAFQVQFSQSMNTSTISVANASHFIYANGTTTTTGYNKTHATIQLSDDNFATTTGLVNCKSISANTGNSLFTVIPETLLKGKSYKIKVKTGVQDLGETNTDLDYITTNTFATGTKSLDPRTGKELVFVDNIPPRIEKISLGSNVLESANVEEITSPESLDALATNLGGDSFVVQFNESMNIATVNVNSSNTDPFGTIQLSCDNFVTVVQMSAQPAVSTTIELNDTFTFAPSHNLSTNANYTLKVTKSVADDSPNQNFLETDNVSSNKVLTLTSVTGTDFPVGDTVIGTRTASTTANSGAVTLNETFLGTTSLAKGILRAHTPGSGTLTSIEYTETASEDGTVKEFVPGEVLTGLTSGQTITTSNATITQAASGEVLSWNTGTKKLTIRHTNTDIAFDATDGILTGVKYGAKGTITATTNAGISTAVTSLTVDSFMRKSDDSIVDVGQHEGAADVPGIDFDSNLIIKFTQTMNTDSIVVNSTDDRVNSSDTIILSADSSFGNCIPLLANPTVSENGSRFEFKPVILSNTSLGLTRGDEYFVKVTRGAKTKGGSNTASEYTDGHAIIVTSPDFISLNASVFDNNGNEVVLGTDNSVTHTNISRSTPIIFHFSDAIDISSFSIGAGAGGHLFISTTSNFSSGMIDGTLKKSGRFGTQIIVTSTSTLAVDTFYVKANGRGHNEGGVDNTLQNFGNFTTA